jgi:hypothetical protein
VMTSAFTSFSDQLFAVELVISDQLATTRYSSTTVQDTSGV